MKLVKLMKLLFIVSIFQTCDYMRFTGWIFAKLDQAWEQINWLLKWKKFVFCEKSVREKVFQRLHKITGAEVWDVFSKGTHGAGRQVGLLSAHRQPLNPRLECVLLCRYDLLTAFPQICIRADGDQIK